MYVPSVLCIRTDNLYYAFESASLIANSLALLDLSDNLLKETLFTSSIRLLKMTFQKNNFPCSSDLRLYFKGFHQNKYSSKVLAIINLFLNC